MRRLPLLLTYRFFSPTCGSNSSFGTSAVRSTETLVESRVGTSRLGRTTMMKRLLILIAFASIIAVSLPGNAVAGKTFVGRITDVTTTSVSVRDKEIVTVTVDARTRYTK